MRGAARVKAAAPTPTTDLGAVNVGGDFSLNDLPDWIPALLGIALAGVLAVAMDLMGALP